MHFRSKSAAADNAAATVLQVGNPAYEESLVVGEIEYAAVDIAGTMHQSFNTDASTHQASGAGYLEMDGTDAGDGISAASAMGTFTKQQHADPIRRTRRSRHRSTLCRSLPALIASGYPYKRIFVYRAIDILRIHH